MFENVVQKAGFEDDRIVECHGSIHFLQCVDTNISSEIWPVPPETTFDVDDDLRLRNAMPTGPPGQHHPARPNILMFGDWIFQGDRTGMQERHYKAFQKNSLQKGLPFVVIEIGAGTKFSLSNVVVVPTVFSRWSCLCYSVLSVTCTECIVAKRCVLEQKLLLIANKKSYMRNKSIHQNE